jgi:hypothetical protein
MCQIKIGKKNPLYLLIPNSSVSNIIRNRIPKDIWLLYSAFWYLANGITNSVGLALKVHISDQSLLVTELHKKAV